MWSFLEYLPGEFKSTMVSCDFLGQQVMSKNYQIHMCQELLFAFFDAQVQNRVALLHGREVAIAC